MGLAAAPEDASILIQESVHSHKAAAPKAVLPNSCTAEDVAVLNSFAGGNKEGTLPKINADCGKKSYKLTFNKEEMINKYTYARCLEQANVTISKGCVQCYVGAAAFGAD